MTIPELEKTIGLMKKVVEKVQRENEQLKKASGILTSEKMANIEMENEKLKVIFLMPFVQNVILIQFLLIFKDSFKYSI